MFLRRSFGAVVIAALIGGLAACGDKAPEQAASAAPQAASAPQQAPSKIGFAITNWGPQKAVAGEAFNKQPDGRSALWFNLNKSVSGHELALQIGNDKVGNVAINEGGTSVSIGVDSGYFKTAGKYDVALVDNATGERVVAGTMTVAQK